MTMPLMTLIHDSVLGSFSEYDNNSFFFFACLLTFLFYVWKVFFVEFVFQCIQIFCSLYFLSLTLFLRKPYKASTMIISVIKYFWFFSCTEISTVVYQHSQSALVHQLIYWQNGLVGVSVEWQSSRIILTALVILLISRSKYNVDCSIRQN